MKKHLLPKQMAELRAPLIQHVITWVVGRALARQVDLKADLRSRSVRAGSMGFKNCLVTLLALLLCMPVFAENRAIILAAEFGVFETNSLNQRVFEASTTVARKTGQAYGWMIAVQTQLERLSVREEYLLPNSRAASSSMEDTNLRENAFEVSFDRQSQVSQRVLVPVDGIIYGEWEVGPNEPAGYRKLRVTIEDFASVDFEFDVN